MTLLILLILIIVTNALTSNDQPNCQSVFELNNNKLCSRCSLLYGGEIFYQNNTKSDVTFVNYSDKLGCKNDDYTGLESLMPQKSDTFQNYQLVLKRGECKFTDRAVILSEINKNLTKDGKISFSGIIFTSDGVMDPGNSTDVDFNLLVCTVNEYDFIKNLNKNNIYGPNDYLESGRQYIWTEDMQVKGNKFYDLLTMSIMWLVAVLTMTSLAVYTSTSLNYTLKLEQEKVKKEASDNDTETLDPDLVENPDEQDYTIKQSLMMVLFASISLTSLYFLYKYVIWIILAISVLMMGAIFSIFIINVVTIINPKTSKQIQNLCKFEIPCCGTMDGFEIIGLTTGLTLSTTWFIFRHSNWSFIILDFLGFCMCVTVPTMIKFKNLKTIVFFLTVFFLYDIFMVFGTPYIMPGDKSIMVEVATGAGTGEILPFLFKVPKLFMDSYTKSCGGRDFNLLGFGDLIVPGIMTCLCVRFDKITRSRKFLKSYQLWAVFSYAFSLACCQVVLQLTKMGQPALLYICPGMSIFIIVTALCRGEFRIFWDKGLEYEGVVGDPAVYNFTSDQVP